MKETENLIIIDMAAVKWYDKNHFAEAADRMLKGRDGEYQMKKTTDPFVDRPIPEFGSGCMRLHKNQMLL